MGNTGSNLEERNEHIGHISASNSNSSLSSPTLPRRCSDQSHSPTSKINSSSPSRTQGSRSPLKERSLVLILEEILQFSPFGASQQRRTVPYKSIQMGKEDPLSLFSIRNFDDLILHIIESSKGLYFKNCDEKIPYLYLTFLRIQSTECGRSFTEKCKEEITKIVLSYFISLVISPDVFDSEFVSEENSNLQDTTCSALTAFYEILKFGVDRLFLQSFFKELPEEDQEQVLHPIFKRILKDTQVTDVYNTSTIIKALELLKSLISLHKSIFRHFCKSSLFIPLPDPSSNILTGYSFQKKSIIASALSITVLPEENPLYIGYFSSTNSGVQLKAVDAIRSKIKEVLDTVYSILEYVAKKDESGRKAVARWLYKAVEVNNDKQKIYNVGSACSSEGFLSNFLYLLLKFCKPFLDGQNELTSRLDKIDPLYLREKKIFDHLSLLNGHSNFYFPSQQEDTNGKFPGSTNLILQPQSKQEVNSLNGEDRSYSENEGCTSRSVEGRSDEDYVSSNEHYASSDEDRTRLEHESNANSREEEEKIAYHEKYASQPASEYITEEEEEKGPQETQFSKTDLRSNHMNYVKQTDVQEPQNNKIDLEAKFDKNSSRFRAETKPKTQIRHYTFLTELIFLINHTLRLTHSQYQKYFKTIARMEKESVNLSFLINSHLAKKLAKKLAFEVHYADPELWANLSRVFMVDTIFIAYNRGVTLESLVEPSSVFNKYKVEKKSDGVVTELVGMIPAYWTENIVQYSEIILDTKPSIVVLNSEPFKVVCNFLLIAMGKSNWINNPHTKADYLKFFNSLLPDIPSSNSYNQSLNGFIKERDCRVSTILVENNLFFEEELMDNLLEFFWDLERTNATHELEKYNYRHIFCQLLNRLTGSKGSLYFSARVNEHLKNLTKNKEVFKKLAYTLLNDMMSLIDDCISKLKTIKKYQDSIHSQEITIFSLQERVEQDAICQQHRQVIHASVKFLNQYYELIYILTSINKTCFLQEEQLEEKFVTSLNYTIAQIIGVNADTLSVQKMKELKFDVRQILRLVSLILLNYKSEDSILRKMVEDERSYDIKFYQNTVLLLLKENLINEDQIYSIQLLMERWKVFSAEKKQEDDFIISLGENIPEEFIDPIMNTIMKEPVLLPTSNVIMDKATVLKHLIVDATDPFNRKDLNEGMLISQSELQQKIKAYVGEKRMAWKEQNRLRQNSK